MYINKCPTSVKRTKVTCLLCFLYNNNSSSNNNNMSIKMSQLGISFPTRTSIIHTGRRTPPKYIKRSEEKKKLLIFCRRKFDTKKGPTQIRKKTERNLFLGEPRHEPNQRSRNVFKGPKQNQKDLFLFDQHLLCR